MATEEPKDTLIYDVDVAYITQQDDKKNKYMYMSVNLQQILKDKFNLTFEEMRDSELLEEAIVKHAYEFNLEIKTKLPDISAVTGNSSWITGMHPLANYLLVDYRGFTREQREILVGAYKRKVSGC